jgi:hypothetical protein
MFEHRHQPLLPRVAFLVRLLRNFGIAGAIVVLSLGIGAAGYHGFEGLTWVDALLNAAMILSGMGPVNVLETTSGKLFATAYALFSGIVFLAITGILFAPVLHRLLHHFHLEVKEDEPK